jgi:hypothetical protein
LAGIVCGLGFNSIGSLGLQPVSLLGVVQVIEPDPDGLWVGWLDGNLAIFNVELDLVFRVRRIDS